MESTASMYVRHEAERKLVLLTRCVAMHLLGLICIASIAFAFPVSQGTPKIHAMDGSTGIGDVAGTAQAAASLSSHADSQAVTGLYGHSIATRTQTSIGLKILHDSRQHLGRSSQDQDGSHRRAVSIKSQVSGAMHLSSNPPKEISQEETNDDDSPPFAVQARRLKFYGGLVTYGHELHPARICRVLNGCVRNDGTVVLPLWMRRHDETLSFHCGIHKLEFSLRDSEPPPSLQNLDLFGSDPAPVPLHEFLVHFAPQLVALDLLSGERTLVTSCHSRIGRKCEVFPLLGRKIRPAIFVHPEIPKQSGKTSWIQQFTNIIPTHNFAHKIHRLSQEIRSEEESDTVRCFRSIVLTRGPRTKYTINRETLRALSLFQKNNLMKTPKSPLERMNANRSLCNVNVMFVNRKKLPRNSSKLGVEGYITNIGRLRSEIQQRAKKFGGLSVTVHAVTLDAKRLKYQMDAMQKAEVLVAGSSSALANMVFLRTNSTVIELMPFGYYPKTFETMARYFADVKYDSYIAHPDQRSFVNCIAVVAPKGTANFTLAQKVITRYKKSASSYRRSDNTHSYTLHTLKPVFDFVRPCAKIQRLSTHPDRFAAAIVRHARLQCGIEHHTDVKILN